MLNRSLTRRSFLKLFGWSFFSLLSTSFFTYLYSANIEPSWVEVKTLSFQLQRLHPIFNGYRIIQMSDIHLDGYWMTNERLKGLILLINQQKPDFDVITGDFISTWIQLSPRNNYHRVEIH